MLKLFARKETRKAGPAGKDYYDNAFASNQDWHDHYTGSGYYFLWTVILDRLRGLRSQAILEIGCGPGQLAAAVAEAGLAERYTGLDFSTVAISLARKACPSHYEFIEVDAVGTDLYASLPYDTMISTEFLEHVDADLEVLAKLRSGTRVLATVPNFPYVSHVRHFDDGDAVARRYGPVFRDFSVTVIPGVKRGSLFYLIQGVKH